MSPSNKLARCAPAIRPPLDTFGAKVLVCLLAVGGCAGELAGGAPLDGAGRGADARWGMDHGTMADAGGPRSDGAPADLGALADLGASADESQIDSGQPGVPDATPPDAGAADTAAPDGAPPDAPTACTKSVGPGQAFTTIQAAVDVASPGDTICVQPGTYHEAVRLNRSGTASQPIVVRAASATRPVIDGAYTLPGGKDYPAGCPGTVNGHAYECYRYEALVSVEANHVVFEGFDVKRSAGRCVRIWSKAGVHDVTVRDNLIHHCRHSGIPTLENASEVLIERNEIYRTNNFAPFSRSASDLDWGAAACTKKATQVTIRGNIFHECWGEGYITDCNTGNSGFITLENNIFYDNYASVGPYIHATHDVTLRNNLIYFSPLSEFYRGGGPMPCIPITASEPQFAANIETRNISITNNIMAGCAAGIAFWGSSTGRTIDGVKVEHNTFYKLLSQDSVSGASASHVVNSSFHNNLSIDSSLDPGGKPASNNLDYPDAVAAGLAGIDGKGTLPPLDRGKVQPGWFKLPQGATAGADIAAFGPIGPTH